MKKKIICIFLPIFGFVLAYYLGYLFGNSLDNSNIILKTEVESNNPIVSIDSGVDAASVEQDIILGSTKLVIEKMLNWS